MGGFEHFGSANSSYLHLISVSNGTLIASPSLTTMCIHGQSFEGACTPNSANGQGVVEVSTIESSGLNECNNTSPCSGLAFDITYQVVGKTPSTPISFALPSPFNFNACIPSSVGTTDTCVFVGKNTGELLPENVQGAIVTQNVFMDLTSTSLSCASPVVVGQFTTCTL